MQRGKAYVERWIGGLRREVVDRTLIVNARCLQSVLTVYEAHFNEHRRHRSPGQVPRYELCQSRSRPMPRPSAAIASVD
ncbi:hypothetical protein ACFY05_39715 [Microtetraspora fusca]|uniref:Integrase catalytic domain-containing protein n=1 Tax=Microtetraspora fusca TaxID=1997 RepID=A0ABW6VHY0_MICFU